MRLVVALGGNALRVRGDPTGTEERAHLELAVKEVAGLAAHHEIVVTHGNGPQVGVLALQSEAASGTDRQPLDVLDAESQGWIGYMLSRGLGSVLPGHQVATLLTQVRVDPADPAFARPTKPIGPVLDRESARRAVIRPGWTVGPDGDGCRRLVPSPQPREVLELPTIRLLLDAGVLVVCAGGGGIPVTVDEAGTIHGTEAVIDKDLTAALIATGVGADGLVLLTDVDGVHDAFGTGRDRLIPRSTPTRLRALGLPAGSMGPKAEAAARFVEAGGLWAAIGRLGTAQDLVEGRTGTRVEREHAYA